MEMQRFINQQHATKENCRSRLRLSLLSVVQSKSVYKEPFCWNRVETWHLCYYGSLGPKNVKTTGIQSVSIRQQITVRLLACVLPSKKSDINLQGELQLIVPSSPRSFRILWRWHLAFSWSTAVQTCNLC
jgi:hypothetical protein